MKFKKLPFDPEGLASLVASLLQPTNTGNTPILVGSVKNLLMVSVDIIPTDGLFARPTVRCWLFADKWGQSGMVAFDKSDPQFDDKLRLVLQLQFWILAGRPGRNGNGNQDDT